MTGDQQHDPSQQHRRAHPRSQNPERAWRAQQVEAVASGSDPFVDGRLSTELPVCVSTEQRVNSFRGPTNRLGRSRWVLIAGSSSAPRPSRGESTRSAPVPRASRRERRLSAGGRASGAGRVSRRCFPCVRGGVVLYSQLAIYLVVARSSNSRRSYRPSPWSFRRTLGASASREPFWRLSLWDLQRRQPDLRCFGRFRLWWAMTGERYERRALISTAPELS